MMTILEKLVSDYIDNKIYDNELKKSLNDLVKDFPKILKILRSIKTDKLYPNTIHGLFHSEKVFFFTYLISKIEKLDAVDFQIMIDAALYHDIGRSNDYRDDMHGYASTLRIDSVIDSGIYQNEENKELLKAIIDGHALDDSRKDFIFRTYELTDYERFSKLYNILKDADALDRARFSESIEAYLDESFLRLKSSKDLIKCAKQINNYYRISMAEKESDKTQYVQNVGPSHCYHGVGFDFFKFRSILESGILCKKEMRCRNICGTINFEGGNLDEWISVIDSRKIQKGNTGYVTFTRHGINFYCLIDNVYMGYPKEKKELAIEKGVPFDHSGHADERYVYKEISMDNVLGIFIPNEYINKNIKDLRYLYNSLSYDIFTSRINYYCNNVRKSGVKVDYDLLIQLIKKHRDTINMFAHLKPHAQADAKKCLVEELEVQKDNINAVIQGLVHENYCREMGFDNSKDLTVMDIVTFELSKANIIYDICHEKDGIQLMFNQKKKSK